MACIGWLFAALFILSPVVLADLPVCKVNTSAISVSGLSAGAFMAVQFHVAYSSSIMAAGVIAGGPYYCAQDQITEALTECMNFPQSVNVDALIAATNKFAEAKEIDDTSNLQRARVWLYSGTHDTVVHHDAMAKLETYYRHFITQGLIETEYTVPSEHGFPTLQYGIACGRLGEPYILKCNYNAALKILQNAYGPLRPAVEPLASNLLTFDQSQFAPPLASLLPVGYAYVPTACRNGTALCSLHVAFHGCEQSTEFIQSQYVEDTGYNGIAESNNIIVIYPQCGKNVLKDNPNGCFDWWGYTGADYALRSAKQMAAVKAMIDHVSGKAV